MNIIVNNDITIRTTQFDPLKLYTLDELKLYIPVNFSEHKMFIILEEELGTYDICELIFDKNNSNYNVYRIPQSQSLRVKSGKFKITIMLIDTNTLQNSKITQCLDINLNIDNYKLSHRLYINEQLQNEVTEMYSKIVELTKLNIDIYENNKGV